MICSPSLATSASKISPSEQFQPNIRLIYSTKISHDRLAIPRDQNTHTHEPTYTKRSPSFFYFLVVACDISRGQSPQPLVFSLDTQSLEENIAHTRGRRSAGLYDALETHTRARFGSLFALPFLLWRTLFCREDARSVMNVRRAGLFDEVCVCVWATTPMAAFLKDRNFFAFPEMYIALWAGVDFVDARGIVWVKRCVLSRGSVFSRRCIFYLENDQTESKMLFTIDFKRQ